MRSRNPNVLSLHLLDIDGHLITKSVSRQYQYSSPLNRREFIETVWPMIYQQPGTLYVGPLKAEQGESYVDMVTLVTDNIGLSSAALVVRVDLTELAKQTIITQIGQTGHVYIVDDQGHIVLAKDIARIGQQSHLGTPAHHAHHAHIHQGIDGHSLFAAVQPLDLVPWYVVIEQPMREAFVPFIWPAILSVLLILVGTVLILRLIRLNIVLTSDITQPINALSQASQALATGQWQVTVPDNSAITELNTLAYSFNRMAENLQKSYAQLETTLNKITSHNQTLKQFLNAMPVGVTIVDADAQPYYSNHRVQDIGYHGLMTPLLDETTSTPSPFYRVNTHTPYPDEQLPIVRALQGESVTLDDIELHVRNQVIALEVWANPIYDQQGTVQYAIAAFQDISQRKQLEAEQAQTQLALERTNQELIRATRLKDEFLANMSHELRTPLNAIMGMTEGLLDYSFGELNPSQVKALKTVHRSANHLLTLINDILDVAKIESGQLELNLQPVGLSALCSSSLAFIKQQAFKKRLQISSDVPPSLPAVMLDERRILQALINLLNNAVKFTPNGGTIRLTADRKLETITSANGDPFPQPFLHLALHDTGIGIAPEDMDTLFQPFVQIDSALNRQYTGTGLGLALVRQLAELHGGSVTVTSEVGVGSCFTLVLPWVESVQAPSPSLTDDMGQQETLPRVLHPPLVLLAEDNEANILTFSSYLKSKGYGLHIAQDGEEAIALAHAEHPDIILMDIQMPKCDGLEAIRRIRNDDALKAIPIIALTALTMKGDRDRCLAVGADEYLDKPVKLKQLVATIQHLLADQY